MPSLYLLGEPGAGKTTAFGLLLDGLPSEVRTIPLLHTRYLDGRLVQLGAVRPGGFGGTDALSMSVQTTALQFVRALPPDVSVVAEGDRLANDMFLGVLASSHPPLTVALLICGPTQAAARRSARGSHQNPSWLKGRQTKVRRLAESWDALVVNGALDARYAADMLATLDPFAALGITPQGVPA